MRYLWQHLFNLLDTYRNEVPLHHFLKNYYKNSPKLGSRDRRGLSDALYAWYRCGKAFGADNHTREEQAMAALFLCGLKAKAFLNQFPDSWNDAWDGPITARLAQLKAEGFAVELALTFPYNIPLSTGITKEQWLLSALEQPHLFLRIRQDGERVGKFLKDASIPFEWINETCLAVPNGSSIDTLLPPVTYVVQDASSQATGAFFKPAANENWWDCCSGAGGKSLLLRDLQHRVQLLSSDVRERILHNLRERFIRYRLPAPRVALIDAADEEAVAQKIGDRLFDGIIADVPCTGSGTWARTPESLYFFDPATLDTYTSRGANILRNVAGHIKPGGRIVYITCSVFRGENEAVLEQVAAEKGLKIVEMKLINGIAIKADCLFVAVLTQE